MRILLFAINGSYSHSNLAIRCLRDALEDAGYSSVLLLEHTLRDRTERTLEALVSAGADLYAFSCYIWNIDCMLALARDLKALCPSAKILFGGPECSYDTERFLELPFVDSVLTGEGEEAIVRAADTAARGEPLPRLLAGTPDANFPTRGIHYRPGEPLSPLVYYESSRGCPFSCAFCLSSATEGVRAKSAEKTLEDLAAFEEFPEPFTVKFVDRTFNFDRERAKKIWRGLLNGAFTKCYHFELCASLLDEESFDLLSRFPPGKVRLEIGLQSIHKKTLAAISRHTDAAAVLTAARRLTAGNCHVHLDLIAGLPYESLSDFSRSFDAAFPACHVLQLGFLKLLHGTSLREECEKYGIVFSEKPPYTVLKTADISFEELALLHRVDELLDRMSNSGRFAAGLSFLTKYLPSPFALFTGFAAFLHANDTRPLEKISQRELFVLFAKYGESLLKEPLHAAFLHALRADFTAHEMRRPPLALGAENT